ncbi:hypothetical protein [Nonomuraea sp. SYSU D8015]|uniref:hypothetical protein n=1 Tax=Nonomuraea sp. SYSU D8015 TaxID=2593644 RepID=UPI001660CF0C|nr:hypothetical protein [Nonomuraea sp. SYSU D8015]
MLIGVVAATLVLGMTWWLVAGRASVPDGGAAAGEAPVLAYGAPEAEAGGTGEEPPAATDTGETPSPELAAEQARRMNELLASSSATRADLSAAIERASKCERRGLAEIEGVTASRRDQLASARGLEVDALPDGEKVKKALVDALDAAFDADAAFLSWARRHVAGDCEGPVNEDRDFQRGVDRSKDARKAKARFAKAWEPIAETHDLTAWKSAQI